MIRLIDQIVTLSYTKKSVDPSEDSAAFYDACCKYQRSSLSKGHDDKQNQNNLFDRYLINSSF